MIVSAIYREGKNQTYKGMSAQTIADIRRANLRDLSAKYGGRDQLAQRINRDRNQIDQLLTRKNMGSNLARKIEAALKLHTGWLDVPHTKEEPASYAINETVTTPYRQDDNAALLLAWSRLDPAIRLHVMAIIERLAKGGEIP